MAEPTLLKMSAFAAKSGVPVPTIKHYVREGLLPQPTRTSRNMAYYDVAWIPRVRAIKRLQSTLHLSLPVIRQVLDRVSDDALPDDVARSDLDLFRTLGLITPTKTREGDVFKGDDVALLELLARARREGLSAQMLPPDILRAYVSALQELVRVELQMFRAGVMPLAGDDLGKLTEVATTLSEQLVILLRRKLLLPTLRTLVRPRPEKDPS